MLWEFCFPGKQELWEEPSARAASATFKQGYLFKPQDCCGEKNSFTPNPHTQAQE